jgi:hypothetical protein
MSPPCGKQNKLDARIGFHTLKLPRNNGSDAQAQSNRVRYKFSLMLD